MFYDITLWVITSLILIILIHYLFNFFKDTLTTPKIKDLIQEPLMRYKNIENITNIPNSTNNSSNNSNNNNIIGTTSIEEIIDNKDFKNNNENDMKSELKNFFNELKQQNSNNNFTNNFNEKLYSEIK
jgi:hypothetical protein